MIQSLITHIIQTTHLTPEEARWLLEHIFNKSYAQLLTLANLPQKQIVALNRILIKINKTNKPLAYILTKVPFLNLTLHLKPPILIPRPETEQWVQQVIQTVPKNHIETILDIGTGSGCIALALASHFKKAQVLGIDINSKAIRLAKQNAKLNNIDNVRFLQSNLFEKLNNQKFDLIVSNPPYINPTKKPTLSKQVIDWEDEKALFADHNGLHIIEQILQNADQYLTTKNTNQQLIFEIDADQNDAIEMIAKKFKWHCQIQKDLFGQWRTAWCKKKRTEFKIQLS